MKINLLTRRRLVHDQEIREPTVLAFVLVGMGLALLLVLGVVAIAGFFALGYIWWVFAIIAAILAWLLLRPRRQLVPDATPTGRQTWFRRLRGLGRKLVIGLLACWLGLIIWAELCPGGPQPPRKTDSSLIRVVTWNVHCGQDKGLPWQQFDWSGRKRALREAIHQANPDILCVQEARPEQVLFLEKALPDHGRAGEGRDGGFAGEHCAIYFSRQRFTQLDSGTFWLEEPIDQPGPSAALDVKRICSWVRLRDRISGRTFRLYNAHLYLTEAPRLSAVRIILAQIAAGNQEDAVLFTADFNASPAVPSRRLFAEAGLVDSAEVAGKPVGKPTFHLYGIGLWCIDGILVDANWRVENHLRLRGKPMNTFPSDHFGLLADLAFKE